MSWSEAPHPTPSGTARGYTPDQLRALFASWGFDTDEKIAAATQGPSSETAQQRIARILAEVNGGHRTWIDVMHSVSRLPGAQRPQPGAQAAPGASGGPTNAIPGVTPADPNAPDAGGVDRILAAFPWLRTLGIPIAQLQEWAVQGLTGEALYGMVIQTQQYKAMFPGIRRDDGTLRMNEASYLQREDDYRTLFTQYGINNPGSHADLRSFFDLDVDPNELKQRLDVYDNVKRGSQDIKDAFYVYSGRHITDDDLYQAVVDPTYAAQFNLQYTQATQNPPDYATYITRATEAGLDRVSKISTDLQTKLPDMTTNLMADQNTARQVADLLYHGGDPSGATMRPLSLQELLHAFEFAMIGSAATQSGLQLPGLERIQALRDAGVTRTAALQAYSDFAGHQNLLAGMSARAGRGQFGQGEFEQAVLLHQGPAEAQLESMQAQEKALGHATGNADIRTDQETGRTVQGGLRAFGQ